jgi:uncharacterized protein DUF4407
VANRDRVAPRLDSEIAAREQALEQTRTTAMKDVDHGLGARWMAMNDHTFASPGAMLLRLVTIVFLTLLILLPLILKLWRLGGVVCGASTSDDGTGRTPRTARSRGPSPATPRGLVHNGRRRL